MVEHLARETKSRCRAFSWDKESSERPKLEKKSLEYCDPPRGIQSDAIFNSKKTALELETPEVFCTVKRLRLIATDSLLSCFLNMH